jgi:hypothetical protein
MPVIANGTTSFTEQSKRAYVATGVFNSAFFSYTGTRDVNNVIQYALGPVSGASSANCVAGHILKENGRKLVPGANPGVTNYMVGVFDSSSLLNGFIDPNNNLFAVYSTDLPNFVGRGVDTVNGPDGTTNDMGSPVFTNGTVTAAKQIRSTTVTVLTPAATVNINASLGQVFTLAQLTGQVTNVTATASPPVGALVYLVVTPAGTGANITFTGANNMKGTTTLTVAGKVTTFAFVSDGTNLNMFAASTST